MSENVVATYVGYAQDGTIIDSFNLCEGDILKVQEQKAKEAQKKFYKNQTELGKMERELGGFYMLYYSEKLFDGVVSNNNIVRVIYLATFIEYGTNRLVIKEEGKAQVALKEANIQGLLGIKDRGTYYNFKKEIISAGIMEIIDGELFMSKDYFNKGKEQTKNNYFIKMYINSIRELYNQVAPKQHKTLSYLFRLVPYINYKYNVITTTPHDSSQALKNRLKKEDIAEILGLDLKTYEKVENQLLKLKITFRGEVYSLLGLVIVRTDIKRKFYVVNPLLYSSGNDYTVLENVWARMLKV